VRKLTGLAAGAREAVATMRARRRADAVGTPVAAAPPAAAPPAAAPPPPAAAPPPPVAPPPAPAAAPTAPTPPRHDHESPY
jgi:hypothetical protein